MNSADVKPSTYIEYNVKQNDKDPKFKVGDHVKILKYKNIFAKNYTPNCSVEVFVIEKVKSTLPWAQIVSDHIV